ncbi:MAG: DNA-processing protein DprA [Clostridiales bacterium]|nr:DNA-processing protein DprA [Clostridiales bacterium]
MIYWIWLGKVPGIGVNAQRALLDYFGSPRAVYEADISCYRNVRDIGEKRAIALEESKSLEKAERIAENCGRCGISLMTLEDDFYPEIAKSLPDMPTHLYYKGIPVRDSTGVAIVGARRCTHEGKEQAVRMAEQFAEKGIPVISGMAKGIDSYAQTACLLAGGYTVGVLGNGLDICYPSEHRLLMQRIEESGMLLSEYEPGVRLRKMYFPRRNRIIAAWSREIHLIDAGSKSGSLITGEAGIRYGRKVFRDGVEIVTDHGDLTSCNSCKTLAEKDL